ncbi:hypothetical protein BLJ79_21650 [Arthrobacter sp. UCD-GKA]|nr:hypothetical protein BLJ79_21650 [Arthrobacter sp. UCD-GKA]
MGATLTSRVGKLVFRLNTPNIGTAGAIASRVLPTAEHPVTPSSDGSFSVELTQTDLLLTDAWYVLSIEWNDASMPNTDFPEWQIRVTGGGTLLDMVVLGPPHGGWGGPLANLSLVLVSLTQPENLQAGQLWLQAAPDSYASPNPALNTGKLFRGA